MIKLITLLSKFPMRLWLKQQPLALQAAVGNVLNERDIAYRSRCSHPVIETLQKMTGLKIHLGCGSDVRAGWVNIDIGKFPSEIRKKQNPDTFLVEYDLRTGLPLATGSGTVIFSSHFFEHLEFANLQSMFAECARVLAPNGLLHFSVPDFERIFSAYLAEDVAYLTDLRPHYGKGETPSGTEALVDLVHYSVHQFGEHKCVYDRKKLALMLAAAGFRDVREVVFDPGLDVDVPVRRKYSVYFEAKITCP